MSTLKLENIKHENSSTNNMVMDSDGSVSTGTLGVTGAFTSKGIDDNADATAITITSQENVGIGTASPSNYGTGRTALGVNGPSAAMIEAFVNNALVSYLHAYSSSVLFGSKTNVPLKLVTNDTIQMEIDGSGRVTKANQPYFSVYVANVGGSGNPSSGAAIDAVPFDTAEFNVGNHFNTSTYRFTAPVNGVYQFNWNLSVYSVAVGSWMRQRVYKNGSDYKIFEYKYSQSTADQHFASSFAIKLDQNDYIEFYANSSDTNFTYSAGALWNTCTGYLLG